MVEKNIPVICMYSLAGKPMKQRTGELQAIRGVVAEFGFLS